MQTLKFVCKGGGVPHGPRRASLDRIPEFSDLVGSLPLQSWPHPHTEPLSVVCGSHKQAESLTQSGKAHQALGCRTEQGPGEGRSLQLAGDPEFGSGKAPLTGPPLTSPNLSASALGRKRSVGHSGQAPKQAADPCLSPRLEFPDASFIFPNLNTRRPRGFHPPPS